MSLLSASRRPCHARTVLLGATFALATAAGCASAPPQATPAMTQAEDAIAQAQRAGAEQLASQPLQEAQARLALAKAAVVDQVVLNQDVGMGRPVGALAPW